MMEVLRCLGALYQANHRLLFQLPFQAHGFRLPAGSFSAGTLENGRFLAPVLLDVKAWRQSSLNVCDS